MSNQYSGNISYQDSKVIGWLARTLEREGLRVIRSFDLRSASVDDSNKCHCTNHQLGTCDCQLVVFLIYGSEPEPATMILQGRDGLASLSLAEVSGRSLSARIMTALRPVGVILSAR